MRKERSFNEYNSKPTNKNNIYQVVLNYKDINGKRKQKWVSTGLTEKGNNKRLANQKCKKYLQILKKI